jgi:hypothetical protein
LGFLLSATEIEVEIFDYDVGTELDDDLLVSSSIRVPHCSTFSANYTTEVCDSVFGCSVEDSLWAKPERKMCNESGVVSFSRGFKCFSASGICLFIDIAIIPFQAEVEYLNSPASIELRPVLGAAGSPQGASWTTDYSFGAPFAYDSNTLLDMRIPESESIEGALMLRMVESEKSKGRANTVNFYASFNFPATVYVCRSEADNAAGVPEWLSTSPWNGGNTSVVRLLLYGTETYYGCFYTETTGTIKNKFDGVKSNALPFYTNTVPGYDTSKSLYSSHYTSHYIVLAVPKAGVPFEMDLEIVYDMAAFINSLFTYGLIWAWITWLGVRKLRKLNFRIDRISTWLVAHDMAGQKGESKLIASLFLSYHSSPCNVEWRGHLYHANNAMIFLVLFLPNLLLIGWGFSIAQYIRPAALGYTISFVGMAMYFLWLGFRLWESSKWRLSAISFACVAASVMFFFFMLSTIFVDRKVTVYGHNLNFAAISLMFATINVLPLLGLVFKEDRTYRVNMTQVLDKFTDAVYNYRNKNRLGKDKTKNMEGTTMLNALLETCYTINPRIPMYRFSRIFYDPPKEETKDPEYEYEAENPYGEPMYNWSMGVLFVYLVISMVRTSYPSLAFLHILSLLFLDQINSSMARGDCKWTPGYKILLLVAGRLVIMGSTVTMWVLNYCLCYVIYGSALSMEMINSFLPILTLKEAGDVAFAGHVADQEPNYDISTTPHFNLGLLTFAFVAVLIVCAYGDTQQSLPAPEVSMLGYMWSPYSFGVLAVAVVICGGLITATARAFYLQKHGLLQGWARKGFMYRDFVSTPIMLGIFCEIAIIASGMLMYAVTEMPAVLILSIFLPIILLSLGYAYREWVKNDYVLVVWPPRDATISLETHNPEDLEVAFHMIENLFGGESNDDAGPETEEGEQKTLKGFSLPPLETTGNQIDSQVKMPPLPLKSVLRRKRQNMGVKTKATAVKDMKGRDGANNDMMGGGLDEDEEAAAAVDPWASFVDGEEKDDDDNKKKRKKEKPKYEVQARGGWGNLPFVRHCKDFLNQYPAWVAFSTKFMGVVKYCGKMGKKYSKIGKVDDEDIDAADSDDEDNDDDHESEDLSKMGFWSAFMGGYLTRDEYRAMLAWGGGMFAIMFMGIALAETSGPAWVCHVIWVAIWMFIITTLIVVKYFNTFKVDSTMKEFFYFMALFHVVFVFSFFGAALNGDLGLPSSLWIFDFLAYYPAFVYLLVELIKWREMGFVILALDEDGDGNVTTMEYIQYFQAYPFLWAMMVVLCWQFYLWLGDLIGNVFLLALLSATVAYVFVRDWAINDFFLSPEMGAVGKMMINFVLFVTFLVALFSETNPIFPISVFLFVLVCSELSSLFTRYMILDPDTMFFFSPYVFPVYSYNPKTNDLVDECDFAKKAGMFLGIGASWGAMLVTFTYPINVGIFVSAVFLMAIATVISTALSYVPQQLGSYVAMISPNGILEAAEVARFRFADRRKPLHIEIKGYESDIDKHAFERRKPTPLQKLQEKASVDLAIDNISETRGLTHVHDDEEYINANVVDVVDDTVKLQWMDRLVLYVKEQYNKIKKMFPSVGKSKGWVRHSESLFTWSDAMAEAVITGRGPVGWIGFDGWLYKLFKFAQDQPNLAFLQQPWLNAYDEFGNNRNYTLLSEHIETKDIMERFMDLDKAIDFVAAEETRAAVHLMTLTMVSAEAKLQREKVLFQKFLRENRFRLASNGITPPSEIFTSDSFSSIDIPLVAVWLSTLSSEERERFHMLKASFSEEQAGRDAQTDTSDRKFLEEAELLFEERQEREELVTQKVRKEMDKRRNDRIQGWADSLHPSERSTFNIRREDWVNNADCFVHYKEQALYDKYKEACVTGEDESVDHGRLELADLEACLRDSRLGEYGRSYQFVDSEYPPGDTSIGDSGMTSQVLGWRCAPGVVDEVHLFSNGSDPNDINAGIFNNQWLLSAISMLAAAEDGGTNGRIAKTLANLFVGHYGQDGEITHNTEVGAFCVRVFSRGMWTPVVVDDLFPMLQRDNWTNENRGLATAHAHESSSFWVGLLEKAYAKFYGSYGALGRGYVHHALASLTGSEAICMPLASASRGVGKRALWDSIIKFQKNGYIMGAGTGSQALVDKEISEMGITFNASYPMYQAWKIDGIQIIKLRNPPGHHDVWKGDWGLASPLWTERLRFKLGFSEEDKDILFISFDDFCNVFRYLYVCKHYDPTRWSTISRPGIWKKALNEEDKKNQQSEEEQDPETKKRMKALAQIDTAGGLPSVDNPGCMLENNPHYSLKIHRPTEIKIEVSQSDSRGQVTNDPHPFSIVVCRNRHPQLPLRMETLGKEDIIGMSDGVVAERTRYLTLQLHPGLYVVMVSTYVHELEGAFTCNVTSNYRIAFESFWPPRWVLGEKQSNEDLVNELANKTTNNMLAGAKKFTKKAIKISKELFGSGAKVTKKTGIVGLDEESESEPESDSDDD